MNERYKKIAEQAGFMLWGDEDWNPGDVVDWSARYDQELEEFANLLIEEVIQELKENNLHISAAHVQKTFK